MARTYLEVREQLNAINNARKKLAELKVLRSEKAFLSDLAEWLVENIYDGKRESSTYEKGWDLTINTKKVQVKGHGTATINSTRRTKIYHETNRKFDELIIMVFSRDYLVKEFYQIPHDVVYERVAGYKLYWDSCTDYKIELSSLPKQELISLFV